MGDERTSNRWRRIRAAGAGALAAIILVEIAAGAFRLDIVRLLAPSPGNSDPQEALVIWLVVGAEMAVAGGGMGIAGSARRIAFRATAAGAVVFALIAEIVPLLPVPNPGDVVTLPRLYEQGWACAAIASFLSITSYAGAFAGGEQGSEGWRPMQFSLRELLLAFVPFAVLFGYMSHLAKLK
jgi:hypothetical protein